MHWRLKFCIESYTLWKRSAVNRAFCWDRKKEREKQRKRGREKERKEERRKEGKKGRKEEREGGRKEIKIYFKPVQDCSRCFKSGTELYNKTIYVLYIYIYIYIYLIYEIICSSKFFSEKLKKLFKEKGYLPVQVSNTDVLGFFCKRISYLIYCTPKIHLLPCLSLFL